MTLLAPQNGRPGPRRVFSTKRSRDQVLGFFRSGSWLAWTVAAVAVAVRLSCGSHPIDDAYITFRYAHNLAQGLGLVYNPGESVLGSSSPLFALLLGGLATVFGSEGLPIYALVINTLSDGLAVLLTFRLARRLGLPWGWAGVASLLLALAPMSIRYSIGGMEASLASAAALAVFDAHLSRRDTLAAFMAGMAVLIRPDSLALGALLTISLLLAARRIPWRTSAILAACFFSAAGLLWVFYGTPVPQTVVAKGAHIYQADPWMNGLQFLYFFGGFLFGPAVGLGAQGIVIVPNVRLTQVMVLPAVLLGTPWVVGAVQALRRERRWLALVGQAPLFAVTYTLLGLRGSVMAEWYFPPLMPALTLLVVSGLHAGLRRLTPHAYTPGAVTLAALLVTLQLAGLNLGRNPDRGFWLPSSVWEERETLYHQAADFLQPSLDSQTVVAASEIGALGYYCGCRILDTVGLVSPQALSYYPLNIGELPSLNAVPAQLIHDADPDYLVSLEIFLRPTVLQDPWFRHNYHLLWSAETDAFGSNGLLIFGRNRGS